MFRHVQELRLRNYRGFRDARLPLEDLTFLVGRNGAGKSTLLDALSFVREALTDSLPTALERRDGIAEVRSRFAAPDEPLTVALVFGLVSEVRGNARFLAARDDTNEHASGTMGRCLYGFSLDAEGSVLREVLRSTIRDFPTFDRDAKKVEMQGASAPLWTNPELLLLPLLAGRHKGLHEDRIAYVADSNRSDGTIGWALLRDSLTSLAVIEPDPRAIRQPSPVRALIPLARDGHNLADVLHALSLNGDVTKVDRLCERLSHICGGISRVHTLTESGYRRILFEQAAHDQSQTFRAASMSNGTLRALAILAALAQRSSPSLLCIEEIEDALHPGALAVLLEAAEAATEPDPTFQRSSFEVLVTTHSTEVLSLPQALGRRIRIVASRDGESTIHTLAKGTEDLLVPPESVGGLLRVNALWPDEAPLRIEGDPLVP